MWEIGLGIGDCGYGFELINIYYWFGIVIWVYLFFLEFEVRIVGFGVLVY